MVNHYATELRERVVDWERRGLPRPRAMLVAGSGLSVDLGEPKAGPFPLAALLPFPIAAIDGHPLSYEIIELRSGLPVLYFRGRVHAYQGFSAEQVVFAVRLGALLGAGTLFVTNAAGSVEPSWPPGSLVLLRDHVNLTGLNPLCGSLPEEWGPQFTDMVDAYDASLRQRVQRLGEDVGVELQEGVYCGLLGPSYETPAEVEMLRRLGADLVGMSTVLEVIAARHMGLTCLGLSLVTNLAAGIGDGHLDHGEVIETGAAAAQNVQRLLEAVLAETSWAAS